MLSGSAQTRSDPLAVGSAPAMLAAPEKIASAAQATATDQSGLRRGFGTIVGLRGSVL
jgi:hypothetical protein